LKFFGGDKKMKVKTKKVICTKAVRYGYIEYKESLDSFMWWESINGGRICLKSAGTVFADIEVPIKARPVKITIQYIKRIPKGNTKDRGII